MASVSKTYKTSDGHPYIIDPKKWVGTPWDESRGAVLEKSNAELIAELHGRLRASQNVSDLFSEKHRATSLGTTGRKPVFEGASKKISLPSGPTPSNKQLVDEAREVNPFSEALKARTIPLEMALPIAWTLPHGYSIKHLDGAHYLPLFAHGLRETKEFLGVSIGDIAVQAFRDVAQIHGETGRVFRQVRIIMLALRQSLLSAVEPSMPTTEAFMIGGRVLACLKIIVTCDDTEYLKGSNAAALFYGSHAPFNLIAAPMVAFRVRVVNSKEYVRKDPLFTDMANQIYETLCLVETMGGAEASKSIASAFPSGFAT